VSISGNIIPMILERSIARDDPADLVEDHVDGLALCRGQRRLTTIITGSDFEINCQLQVLCAAGVIGEVSVRHSA